LPEDIEDFFESEIESESTLRVLLGYEIVDVSKNGSSISEALLQEKERPTHFIRVKFRYLIDGTETGRVMERAGVPFNVGFDVKEQTGEGGAMPESVKDLLEHEIVDGKAVGNRVQPISVPFALLDKGYNGSFIGPSKNDLNNCWLKSDIPSFVNKQLVYLANENNCHVQYIARTAFSDSYDIYFINHNNASVHGSLTSANPQLSVGFEFGKIQDQSFVKIGTWSFNANEPVYIDIAASARGFSAEGIILVKRNVRQEPIILSPVRSLQPFSFDYVGYRRVLTDFYFSPLNNFQNGEQMQVIINSRKYQGISAGSGVYVIHDVPIFQQGNSVQIQEGAATSANTWRIIILPVSFVYSADQAVEVEAGSHLKQNSANVIDDVVEYSWDVTPNVTDYFLFTINWSSGQWSSLSIVEKGTDKEVQRISFDNRYVNREEYSPLQAVLLRKNVSYVVRFGTRNATTSRVPIFRIIPLSLSNIAYSQENRIHSMKLQNRAIFDVWVHSKTENRVKISAMSDTIEAEVPKGNIFFPIGKIFSDKNEELRLSAMAPFTVVLIPSDSADIFDFDTNQNGKAALSYLPPGRFSIAIDAGNLLPSPPQYLYYKSSIGDLRKIALTLSANMFIGSGSIIHEGGPMEIFVEKVGGSGSVRVSLFESIPKVSRLRFGFERPLLKETISSIPLVDQITFFNYRNIISPSRLLSSGASFGAPADIGTNSLGLSIVMNSFSDFAPVAANAIDSPLLDASARQLAYAYYYWLKYESPLHNASYSTDLACDSDYSFICDPRRLLLATNILGTGDGFSRVPYVREGRRIQSVRIMTEADFAVQYSICTDNCETESCEPVQEGKYLCPLYAQEPVLFDDAIAAVYYPFDVHSLFSISEQHTQSFRELFQEVAQANVDLTGAKPFWQFQRESLPVEISLGSVLAKNEGNLLPASINFGTSQIANSALRTHTVEMRLGAAVGYLVPFALQHNVSVHDIYRNRVLMKEFQEYLIDAEMILYPIQDAMYSSTIRHSVQYLLIHKLIKPEARMVLNKGEKKSFQYYIDPHSLLSEADNSLLQLLALNGERPPTYKELIRATISSNSVNSEEILLTIGRRLHLLDEEAEQGVSVLSMPVKRAALFQAVVLYLMQQAELRKMRNAVYP